MVSSPSLAAGLSIALAPTKNLKNLIHKDFCKKYSYFERRNYNDDELEIRCMCVRPSCKKMFAREIYFISLENFFTALLFVIQRDLCIWLLFLFGSLFSPLFSRREHFSLSLSFSLSNLTSRFLVLSDSLFPASH